MELRFGLGWRCFVCFGVVVLDISIEDHEVHAVVSPFDVNNENYREAKFLLICTDLCSYNLQCFHCSMFDVLCALVAVKIKEMKNS